MLRGSRAIAAALLAVSRQHGCTTSTVAALLHTPLGAHRALRVFAGCRYDISSGRAAVNTAPWSDAAWHARSCHGGGAAAAADQDLEARAITRSISEAQNVQALNDIVTASSKDLNAIHVAAALSRAARICIRYGSSDDDTEGFLTGLDDGASNGNLQNMTDAMISMQQAGGIKQQQQQQQLGALLLSLNAAWAGSRADSGGSSGSAAPLALVARPRELVGVMQGITQLAALSGGAAAACTALWSSATLDALLSTLSRASAQDVDCAAHALNQSARRALAVGALPQLPPGAAVRASHALAERLLELARTATPTLAAPGSVAVGDVPFAAAAAAAAAAAGGGGGGSGGSTRPLRHPLATLLRACLSVGAAPPAALPGLLDVLRTGIASGELPASLLAWTLRGVASLCSARRLPIAGSGGAAAAAPAAPAAAATSGTAAAAGGMATAKATAVAAAAATGASVAAASGSSSTAAAAAASRAAVEPEVVDAQLRAALTALLSEAPAGALAAWPPHTVAVALRALARLATECGQPPLLPMTAAQNTARLLLDGRAATALASQGLLVLPGGSGGGHSSSSSSSTSSSGSRGASVAHQWAGVQIGSALCSAATLGLHEPAHALAAAAAASAPSWLPGAAAHDVAAVARGLARLNLVQQQTLLQELLRRGRELLLLAGQQRNSGGNGGREPAAPCRSQSALRKADAVRLAVMLSWAIASLDAVAQAAEIKVLLTLARLEHLQTPLAAQDARLLWRVHSWLQARRICDGTGISSVLTVQQLAACAAASRHTVRERLSSGLGAASSVTVAAQRSNAPVRARLRY